MKFQDSEKLQTVLTTFNQELSRNEVSSSYQRLRTMIRKFIDQTIRIDNFKFQNERIETGSDDQEIQLEKSQRREKSRKIDSVKSDWIVREKRLS